MEPLFQSLSLLDIVLILLFLFIIFSLPFFLEKKTRSPSQLEFFLMSRRLSLPLFVCTLVATWYGGIFGVTKIIYNQGIFGYLSQGVFWYVSYFLVAFVLLPKVFSYIKISSGTSQVSIYSLSQLVGIRLGTKAEKITAFFNIIDVLPISYILSLGLLLSSFFNLNLFLSMLLGGTFVACYSIRGGFKSIVYTDALQFFLMFLSVFLVVFFSIQQHGSPDKIFFKSLPKSHFHLFGGESFFSVLMWFLLPFSTFVDPNFYQRFLATGSLRRSKQGLLIAIVIWIIFDIFILLGTLYAKSLIPFHDPKSAYLYYAVKLLPNGIRGLFLVGVLALVLSTLDSYLFTSSKLISLHFSPFKKNNSIFFSKCITFALILPCSLFGLYFEGDLKEIWRFLAGFNFICLFLPVSLLIFYEKIMNEKTFIVSSLAPAVVMIFYELFLHKNSFFQVDTFYVGILCSFVVISASILKKNIRQYFFS